MATFNGGPYLAAQLASMVEQDRLPDELVISDDGSCDETEQVVKEFAGTAPFPVIWLRNPGRRGYQRNVDFALAATIGDVILFADQDDVWLAQHISHLVTPFETDPRLMITAGDSRLMDATGALAECTVRETEDLTPARVKATNTARGASQFRAVLHRRAVCGHSMALRRRVLEVASPLPSSWMPDEWIFLIGAAMGRVRYVDDVISRFRRYSRLVPGTEYRRVAELLPGVGDVAEGGGFGTASVEELVRWQNLLARLKYAGSMLPAADRVVADVTTKVRLIAFRDRVRQQPAPVRAVRVLPWLLSGRYHRLGRGFRTCARDLVGR
jgi:glycosyltransferase involved in cell wall biosynthesis